MGQLLGSTSETVFQKARCNVFIVPGTLGL
jgi:nucleotide-binding universal stress UspA family protein